MEKVVAIVLFIALISCDKERIDDCFQKHGSTTSEVREVGKFNNLKIDGNVSVELIQDSVQYVEVVGGKNLLNQIKTEVTDNTLEISDNIGCKFVRSYDKEYKVKVHGNSYRSIAHYASKPLTANYILQAKSFDIDKWAGGGDVFLSVIADSVFTRIHAGSGDIQLTGSTYFSYVFQRGFGFIDLSNLVADEAYADKGGTGDCFVNVSQFIELDFDSPGNLHVFGNPTISIVHLDGSGKLIRVDQ